MDVKAVRQEYKNILIAAKPIKIGPGHFKFGDAARFMDGLSVGAVHTYERWAAEWKKFLDLFKDPTTGKINGWTITREKMSQAFIPGPGVERRHTFVIRGYFGLKDADGTEETFDALVEAIVDIFLPYTTLNGKVEQVEAPLQVDIANEPRMFGGVLCHYCELRQVVPETKEFTEK